MLLLEQSSLPNQRLPRGKQREIELTNPKARQSDPSCKTRLCETSRWRRRQGSNWWRVCYFCLGSSGDCDLLERWAERRVWKKILPSWKLECNYEYHPNGRIWMAWDPKILTINVLKKTDQFIHGHLLSLDSSVSLLVTFVYAHPNS